MISSVVSEKETTATSALNCQKLCQENSNSKLFNWNSASKKCYLRYHLNKGEESFNKDVFTAVVGARDCSDVNIIWPLIYPPGQEVRNTHANNEIPIPPTPPRTTTTPTTATSTIATPTTSPKSSGEGRRGHTMQQNSTNDSSRAEIVQIPCTQPRSPYPSLFENIDPPLIDIFKHRSPSFSCFVHVFVFFVGFFKKRKFFRSRTLRNNSS